MRVGTGKKSSLRTDRDGDQRPARVILRSSVVTVRSKEFRSSLPRFSAPCIMSGIAQERLRLNSQSLLLGLLSGLLLMAMPASHQLFTGLLHDRFLFFFFF